MYVRVQSVMAVLCGVPIAIVFGGGRAASLLSILIVSSTILKKRSPATKRQMRRQCVKSCCSTYRAFVLLFLRHVSIWFDDFDIVDAMIREFAVCVVPHHQPPASYYRFPSGCGLMFYLCWNIVMHSSCAYRAYLLVGVCFLSLSFSHTI